MLLYCFHYDPSTGKYGLVIMNVLRLGGASDGGVLAGFMIVMLPRAITRTGGPRDEHFQLFPGSRLHERRPGGRAVHVSGGGQRADDWC